MGSMIKRFAGVVLLLLGLAVFLFPDLYSFWFQQHNEQIIQTFQEEHTDTQTAEENADTEPADPLYAQMQAYNQQIYEEYQSGITDAWTFDSSGFDFGLEDDLFGYLVIPAMEVKLPLYLGATNENMAKGAVVLGQTSIPIGGRNTNAVIAGHRGYQGAPYFREIERLSIGDTVLVTNPWETLTYQVTALAVVQPDDSDAVMIQPEKDMVTLVTCHPYRSHGKFRYLVYCERVTPDGEEIAASDTPSDRDTEHDSGTVEFQSSEPAIQKEQLLRIIGAAVILILLIIIFHNPDKKSE